MDNSKAIETFQILEMHKKTNYKVFRTTTFINFLQNKKIEYTNFKQGEIGNCGLVSSLASLINRPEFITKIAPKFTYAKNRINFHFKMFKEGKPNTITVDDALYFSENNYLLYAHSLERDSLLLSSFLEKAFVKQACYNSYQYSIATRPVFVFSCFSDSVVGYRIWERKESKTDFKESLKVEVENKSSIVLGVTPFFNSLKSDGYGHAYTVVGYNNDHDALKLYDARCNPNWCVSDKNLPENLTADPRKGELWVSVEELNWRQVQMTCLHSEGAYKSVFKTDRRLKPRCFDRNGSVIVRTCRINVHRTSTFMLNAFSYTDKFEGLEVQVTSNGRRVELDYLMPEALNANKYLVKLQGQPRTEYLQKFSLQRGVYEFSLKVMLGGLKEKEAKLLVKLACESLCDFKKLK